MPQAVMSLDDALRALHTRGQNIIVANTLANEMWPNARHSNTNGQTFNLASGIAGRMLRNCRAVVEVENRRWRIVPELLPAKTD